MNILFYTVSEQVMEMPVDPKLLERLQEVIFSAIIQFKAKKCRTAYTFRAALALFDFLLQSVKLRAAEKLAHRNFQPITDHFDRR